MSAPLGGVRCLAALVCAFVFGSSFASAATFGAVIPVRGHISDIALDPTRGLLYSANFTANRIEVLSLASNALQTPIEVAPQPSALAVSPDGRFLVVGHYAAGSASPSVALTILNRQSGGRQHISLGTESVLAAAFGNGSKALIVTTGRVRLLDPETGELSSLVLRDFASTPLPVPWATFPAGIISGSAGISGDGNVIYALIDHGSQSTLIRYGVADNSLLLADSTSSPALGPRVVSVDQTGTSVLSGWTMLTLRDSQLFNLAQFPYAPGILYQGAHAFDPQNNLIYAQVTPGAIQVSPSDANGAPALLQIFDADNLTVRETFQLRENLAGKALVSDGSIYAISDSGLTVMPTVTRANLHRVTAVQEDLLFQASGCGAGVLSQYLDIVDPNGNATDFTLKTSSPGVTFSATSGITPARVQVLVDPAVFLAQKGTVSVPVQISSSLASNVPRPVRLLINTKNPDQKGAVYNVPGTVVDILADPLRNQFFVLRQDQNQVIVFDATSMDQIGTLRTGNTPVQMAIVDDQLLVTNDNSQLVNVFDLRTLQPKRPVFLPSGNYARSIAVAGGRALLTARSVGAGAPGQILTLDIPDGIANAAYTSIYQNKVDPNSALAASPSGWSVFLAMPDGTVALYDRPSGLFVASRKDVGPLSGAYAALSDEAFFAGKHVFGPSLVPIGQVDLLDGISSGVTASTDLPLVSSAPAAGKNGVIQRFSMDSLASIFPARTAEAPALAANLTRTPLGQTGQTILPFTRTLAPLTDGQNIVQLSTSGFTVIPSSFDAASVPPVIGAVTNAADQSTAVAPGSLITVWGKGLADSANPVCLFANTFPVPVLFASPGQINAQLPFNLVGAASLTLSTASGTSAPFRFTSQPAAPALFHSADGVPTIYRTSDGRQITDATPIHLNDKLIIFLTGLGPVTPNAVAGVPAAAGVTTSSTPQVFIGPTQLFTLSSSLVPGMIGVNEIDVQVPFHNISTGPKIQFTIIQNGVQTKIMLPVQQ